MLLESRSVLRETMPQPMFAACVVIINNSPFRLTSHEKSTVNESFAAVGTGLYSTVVRCTET